MTALGEDVGVVWGQGQRECLHAPLCGCCVCDYMSACVGEGIGQSPVPIEPHAKGH